MRSEKEIAGGSAIESPPSKELELRKSEVDLGFLRVGLKEGIGGGCIYSSATEAEASASDEREREGLYNTRKESGEWGIFTVLPLEGRDQ